MSFVGLNFFFFHVGLPDPIFEVLDGLVFFCDIHFEGVDFCPMDLDSLLEVVDFNGFMVDLLDIQVFVPLVLLQLARHLRTHRVHLVVL